MEEALLELYLGTYLQTVTIDRYVQSETLVSGGLFCVR